MRRLRHRKSTTKIKWYSGYGGWKMTVDNRWFDHFGCPKFWIPRHGVYRNVLRPSVCLSVTFRVRAITYVRFDGLPSNLVQMLSSFIEAMCSDLDQDPYIKGQGHTPHLKVRVHMHRLILCALWQALSLCATSLIF